MNYKLLANVRFYFAQAVFTTNCHFKASVRINKRKNKITNFALFLSAMTITVLILQVIGLEQRIQTLLNILAYIGMMITLLSLIIEIFNKKDLSLAAIKHKIFAEKYKALRDEYMSLIEEIMSNSKSETELRTKKEKLQERYSSLGEYAPGTTSEDYKQSQKSLGLIGNTDEEFTWADSEIDKFLPKQLRLNTTN